MTETDTDLLIDVWHDGYFARRDGVSECPHKDAEMIKAWTEGRDQNLADRRIVVLVSRPEGYYHAPIGTFD